MCFCCNLAFAQALLVTWEGFRFHINTASNWATTPAKGTLGSVWACFHFDPAAINRNRWVIGPQHVVSWIGALGISTRPLTTCTNIAECICCNLFGKIYHILFASSWRFVGNCSVWRRIGSGPLCTKHENIGRLWRWWHIISEECQRHSGTGLRIIHCMVRRDVLRSSMQSKNTRAKLYCNET